MSFFDSVENLTPEQEAVVSATDARADVMRERLLEVTTARIVTTLLGAPGFKVDGEDVVTYDDVASCAILAFEATVNHIGGDEEDIAEETLAALVYFNERLSRFIQYAIEADAVDETLIEMGEEPVGSLGAEGLVQGLTGIAEMLSGGGISSVQDLAAHVGLEGLFDTGADAA